jgi:TonB family protein
VASPAILLLLFLSFPPLAGETAPAESAGRDSSLAGSGPPASAGNNYHVRLMRVRFDGGRAGSALFKPEELVVPLSEWESWGLAEQIESLREALGAIEIEPVPGLVVAEGATPLGQPHRFRTALGETLVDFSFLAERLPDGWHRVRLGAEDESGEEILDASLLVQHTETVAVVGPLSDDVEALVIGVTPMVNRSRAATGIKRIGGNGMTDPVLIPGSQVMPVYPDAAQNERFTGKVVLEAVIRADGIPDGIVVLQMPVGGEHLAGAAVEAISQWRYEPATIHGEPVPVYYTLVANFQLK